MTTYGAIKKTAKMNILVCFRSLLLSESLCRAIGRDSNGHRALASHDMKSFADFKPDLILVDFAGLSQDLFLKWPDGRVILIDTGLPEADTVRLMRTFKLYGVISPDEDFHQFKKALGVIQEGQIWIDNAKLKAVLHGKAPENPAGGEESLSKKETQIIELVAEGYKNKEIASMLFHSEQTVKSHLGRIFKKMHITNRSQLVSLTIKKRIREYQPQV